MSTNLDGKRLNCWAIKHFSHSAGRFLVVAVTMVLLAGNPLLAQSSDAQDNRKVLTPDAPGLAHNHRLILKDGNYQIVRQYEVLATACGSCLLLERGEWEEFALQPGGLGGDQEMGEKSHWAVPGFRGRVAGDEEGPRRSTKRKRRSERDEVADA